MEKGLDMMTMGPLSFFPCEIKRINGKALSKSHLSFVAIVIEDQNSGNTTIFPIAILAIHFLREPLVFAIQ